MTAPSYSECTNKLVRATNGVDYAYRELGVGAVPLVLLQHFRGNLDYWDPALIDALAARRRLIPFDNAGGGVVVFRRCESIEPGLSGSSLVA